MRVCSLCKQKVKPTESHYKDSADPPVRVCLSCAEKRGMHRVSR